jgi:hypothetical protein
VLNAHPTGSSFTQWNRSFGQVPQRSALGDGKGSGLEDFTHHRILRGDRRAAEIDEAVNVVT